MKTEQLSKRDQDRVSDALAKCAAATKSIDDPTQLADAAYSIFKESLGDNPRLFKVACRVYNSCKSIHRLSSADDNSRGDTFAILDANSLTDRLAGEAAIAMRKAASCPATFGTVPVQPNHSMNSGLKKAASATDPTKLSISAVKMSKGECRAALTDVINSWESLIKEASWDVRKATMEQAAATDLFIATLSSVPTAMRKSAAAKVYANYGVVAEAALNLFNQAKPMYKVASTDYVGKYKGTPIIEDKDLANAIHKFATATDAMFARKAYLEKAAAECTRTIEELLVGIKKSAALADTAVRTAVTADIMADVPKMLGYDYSDDKAKSELANIEIENAIIAAGSRRAFMKAIQDDHIASYPLPEIIDAFNKAYASLPPSARRMPATKNQALINAEMIANLAEGNTPSKADREHLIQIMKNYDSKTPVGVVESLVVG